MPVSFALEVKSGWPDPCNMEVLWAAQTQMIGNGMLNAKTTHCSLKARHTHSPHPLKSGLSIAGWGSTSVSDTPGPRIEGVGHPIGIEEEKETNRFIVEGSLVSHAETTGPACLLS